MEFRSFDLSSTQLNKKSPPRDFRGEMPKNISAPSAVVSGSYFARCSGLFVEVAAEEVFGLSGTEANPHLDGRSFVRRKTVFKSG